MSEFGLGNEYKVDMLEKDEDESDIYKFYDAKNNQLNKDVCLKIFKKENTEEDEEEINYDFILNQIKKEGDVLTNLDSNHIIKFYKMHDNNKYRILEIENFDKTLYNYMEHCPIFEKDDKSLFKKIILDLVEALKELKEKRIIHRNIKPKNIFIQKVKTKEFDEFEESDESEEYSDNNINIKLANFDCAISAKEVENSKPMGTFMYMAPEIINNSKYNESSDLWSLGITLFEIYFGCFPFGQKANFNTVRNIIDGKEQFIYRKTEKPKLPTLDVLFKRLLCINPEERMTLEELIDFVNNENFLKENIIYDNKKYTKFKYTEIYKLIEKEEQIKYEYEKEEGGKPEYIDKIPTIKDFLERINDSGIIVHDEIFKEDKKFNNIIYYDEINDKKFKKSVFKDCDNFEENTPGSFIFCDNTNHLEIVKYEIFDKFQKNEKYKFNLITTGSAWEKTIGNIISKDNCWKKIIQNVCIYCTDIKKYNYLSKEYDIIKCVWKTPDPVVKFIKKTASKDIEPFPLVKVITYEKYKKDYNIFHKMVSAFYGKNKKEIFEKNYAKMEELIDEEKKTKKLKRSEAILKKSFSNFDDNEEKEKMNSIINDYSNQTFYGDFNNWLRNLGTRYYCTIAYFASRLIYCLNNYGKTSNKYFNENTTIYRGMTLPFVNVLPYIRAENKIIVFSSFTSTSIEKDECDYFAKRGKYGNRYKGNDFSVVFYINNHYEDGFISNGVDIIELAKIKKEKEILYQAFSFYHVEKVDINLVERSADIKLRTIGKKCILEEEIKKGNDFEFDEINDVMKLIIKK